MPRPTLEVADIFRQYGAVYRKNNRLRRQQLRVMRAIETCRTAALGGHREKCSHCAHKRTAYNSCRNRHCPKCQHKERAEWLAKRRADLLPVPYFHVVFTVPQQIAEIALFQQNVVYNILFRATAETLLTIARDPQHLGADIGFFAVLHTWGQNLLHHPHLHCVVPGGGLSPDGSRWVASRRPDYFLPVKVLSRLFRRLFLSALKTAFAEKRLSFHGSLAFLQSPSAFAHYLEPLQKIDWVVYAKPPFGGPQQAIEYLGRYTHRIALSNERLLDHHNGHVTFQWKDYRSRHKQKSKRLTLAADEFMRRFLLHALPPGFQRIRHFGLLANCHRQQKLTLCRQLLATPATELLPPLAACRELASTLPAESLFRCPVCRIGTMIRVETLPPYRWPTLPPNSS